MKPARILERSRLDELLEAPRALLFKHSTLCSISDHAFSVYERFVASAPDLATGWIEVREQRDWSQDVAHTTGVPHESPQALYVVDGAVAWHASHWDITIDALAEAVPTRR